MLVPCDSQLWAYNATHGAQEQLNLLQRLGSLLRGLLILFPHKDCELQYS